MFLPLVRALPIKCLRLIFFFFSPPFLSLFSTSPPVFPDGSLCASFSPSFLIRLTPSSGRRLSFDVHYLWEGKAHLMNLHKQCWIQTWVVIQEASSLAYLFSLSLHFLFFLAFFCLTHLRQPLLFFFCLSLDLIWTCFGLFLQAVSVSLASVCNYKGVYPICLFLFMIKLVYVFFPVLQLPDSLWRACCATPETTGRRSESWVRH